MVNLHTCHSRRKESKSWVVKGVQQQSPSHSELGWDGIFLKEEDSTQEQFCLPFMGQGGRDKDGYSNELGYLKREKIYIELVIHLIMVCSASNGHPTVNGCSYLHRHVTAPMTQLDNTTTGGISISVVTSKLTYVIATHSHINTESPPNTHIQVLSGIKQ